MKLGMVFLKFLKGCVTGAVAAAVANPAALISGKWESAAIIAVVTGAINGGMNYLKHMNDK